MPRTKIPSLKARENAAAAAASTVAKSTSNSRKKTAAKNTVKAPVAAKKATSSKSGKSNAAASGPLFPNINMPPKATIKKAAPKKVAPKKAPVPKAASKNAAANKKASKIKDDVEDSEMSEVEDTAGDEQVNGDDASDDIPDGATKSSTSSKKRKARDESSEEPEDDNTRVVKKAKTSTKKTAAVAKVPVTKQGKVSAKAPAVKKEKPVAKPRKAAAVLNETPQEKLDVYVFGEGTSGELGLGSTKYDGGKIPIEVKRPRINHNLAAQSVGVVQVSTGGMHGVALTHDNKILTWGVNDQGALGRDTTWSAPLQDADADDSASDDSDDFDDTAMNPRECTPTPVDGSNIPEGTIFVQVCASDSATFMLTSTGSVYGCGTFRSNDGVLGFTETVTIQKIPVIVHGLNKIVSLVAGSNHILALTEKGNVLAWGAGQQNQLGRRIVERHQYNGLVPREFGLPRGKIISIASGGYHSFAIDKSGKVWTWGLNSFGQCGIPVDEDGGVIMTPTVVEALEEFKIKDITGGNTHSVASTEDGKLLVWGRVDGHQCGIDVTTIPDDYFVWSQPPRPWGPLPDPDHPGQFLKNDQGWPVYGFVGEEPPKVRRILSVPTVVPGIVAAKVAAGSDNSFAIDDKARAYSWGFSANFQTGQGTDDDVKVATLIDSSAVRGKEIVWAGAGGQYGILCGVAAQQ